MKFRRKTLTILTVLAFAGAGSFGCGEDDPPSEQQNQNDEQQNDNGDNDNGDNDNGDNDNGDNDNGDNGDNDNGDNGDNDVDLEDAPSELGQVLMSEFMKSPTEVSVDDGQWIEFYNATDGEEFDLQGCTISTSELDDDVEIDASLPIDSGEFATVASSDAPGFAPDIFIDELSLSQADGEIEFRCGEEMIAAVYYDDGETYPSTDGTSLVRDPDFADDDTLDAPWLWCEGTESYNGDDLGTPGQMAEACPWFDEATADDITAIRDDVEAGEGSATFEDMTLNQVMVTYVRDEIGGDSAGFFLQASPDGPALFVPVDVEDADELPVRAGQVIDLDVEAAESGASGVQITEYGDLDVIRLYISPSLLTTDVTDADDVIDNIDAYESRLLSAQMTIESEPGFAGGGYESYAVSTTGIESGLEFRVPYYQVDSLGLEVGCELSIADVPMWRFMDTAQLSAWHIYEVELLDCEPTEAVSASALSSTEVQVDFSRALGDVDEDGDDFSIDGLTVESASYDYGSVILETSEQDDGAEYTVDVEPSLDDFWGNEVTGSAEFGGFEALDVAISEFMARFQSGINDPGQYLELHNPGSDAYDLSDCVLDRPNQPTDGPEDVPVDTIPAGEEVVFTATDGGDGGIDDDGELPLNLVNGGTTVELRCGGDVVDAITYSSGDVELGVSMQKDVDFVSTPNPEGGLADGWCLTPQESQFEYTTGTDDGEPKYGTPGGENTTCE